MDSPKHNLRHLSSQQLESLFEELGEKKYRVHQVEDWLWKKGASHIHDMLNLSKALREQLEKQFTLNAVTIDHTQQSSDGTLKNRFLTFDGHYVEGVLIPTETR
ncbi:MAG TPA: 23S rRNA (adenine(2503)-C(2))-methyltransferase RlmN, partial [Chitinophagaceae bacterium]|nr:23S rRNA (adenine(2503)-C(2))-methyltransferase RlmN [Chitinophagaceae bacterium]